MKLSPSNYDFAQKLVRLVLPGLAVLYSGLAVFWGLPKAPEVAGSIALLSVFLGTLLAKSSADFKKNNEADAGVLQQTGVDQDTGHPDIGLIINQMPADLLENETVTFKVDKQSTMQPPAPSE